MKPTVIEQILEAQNEVKRTTWSSVDEVLYARIRELKRELSFLEKIREEYNASTSEEAPASATHTRATTHTQANPDNGAVPAQLTEITLADNITNRVIKALVKHTQPGDFFSASQGALWAGQRNSSSIFVATKAKKHAHMFKHMGNGVFQRIA